MKKVIAIFAIAVSVVGTQLKQKATETNLRHEMKRSAEKIDKIVDDFSAGRITSQQYDKMINDEVYGKD